MLQNMNSTDASSIGIKPKHPVIRHLGIQCYQSTWEAMKRFVYERDKTTCDEIWLLEHYPVFTLGQTGKTEHILNRGDIPVVQSDRGGEVTYHGPGQIVAYLMIDWSAKGWHSRSLVDYIESALIELLADLHIPCQNNTSAPGIYTKDGRKIASLGLRMKRQSSYHGLALNVDMDLEPFSRINPCGYQGLKMAQIRDFCPNISLEEVQNMLCKHLTLKLLTQ